jgi:hypothetical protein
MVAGDSEPVLEGSAGCWLARPYAWALPRAMILSDAHREAISRGMVCFEM